MLIAWSGHRPDVFSDPELAEGAVTSIADQKASPGVEFICGGQRGVDQWAARAALALRLRYHLILPARPERFTVDWSVSDQTSLTELMSSAASVQVMDETGDLGRLAYDLRSEVVVRRADLLVVVWTGLRRGGTFHTLCAARAMRVPVEEVLFEGVGGQASGIRGL